MESAEGLYKWSYFYLEDMAAERGCDTKAEPVVDWICQNAEALANALWAAGETYMAYADPPPGAKANE